MTDYSLRGPATLSQTIFTLALEHRTSPAVDEAELIYETCERWGVDPGPVLGVFLRESTMGTNPGWYGFARDNRNWGNLRASPENMGNDGRFASYATWTAAVNALCWTWVRGGLYLPRTDTVSKMAAVWAPAADGNDPVAYAAFVNDWCERWQHASEALVDLP